MKRASLAPAIPPHLRGLVDFLLDVLVADALRAAKAEQHETRAAASRPRPGASAEASTP